MLVLKWVRNAPIPGLKLEWRGPVPRFKLGWMGPSIIDSNWVSRNGLTNLDELGDKLAVISGPQGAKGDKGEPGVTQIIIEGGDAPTVLDGGNF